MNYELCIMNYELCIMHYELKYRSYKLHSGACPNKVFLFFLLAVETEVVERSVFGKPAILVLLCQLVATTVPKVDAFSLSNSSQRITNLARATSLNFVAMKSDSFFVSM